MSTHINISSANPNLMARRAIRRWVTIALATVALLIAGLGLPAMGATAWAASPSWPPDPSSNVPFTGPHTVTNELANINHAHQLEDVPPVALPSNWGQLTAAQQLFVIVNLERTSRGLAPVTLLSQTASQCAYVAASEYTDPAPTLPGCQAMMAYGPPLAYSGALGDAGSGPGPLFVDYEWMYLDGPGAAGINADCMNGVTWGCWDHRNGLLLIQSSTESVMGAATSNARYLGAAAVAIEWLPSTASASQLGSVFTWAQEEPFLQTPNASTPGVGSNPSESVSTPTGGQGASVGAPSYFTPITPTRICDTRPGNPSNLSGPYAQCNGNTLQPDVPETIQVTGLGGIPSGATAVVVNATVTDAQSPGHLMLYPAGGTPPMASNLNWVAGQTVANEATVELSASGQMSMVSNTTTDVIMDVEGYYSSSGAGTESVVSARICDTRPGNPSNLSGPNAQCNGHPLQPGVPLTIQAIYIGGVDPDATAVIVNVTVTDTQSPGYLTLYPAGGTPPMASNLNWVAGQTVANEATVELGTAPDGRYGFLSIVSNAPTDVIVDVQGFYVPGGDAFYPVTPARIVDTRAGNPSNLSGPALQYVGHPVQPGVPYNVSLAGIIPTSAEGVVLNVMVPPALGGPGYMTVYPSGLSMLMASNLNGVPNETVANAVVVNGGQSQEVAFYTPQDFANLVVDLDGVFGPAPN